MHNRLLLLPFDFGPVPEKAPCSEDMDYSTVAMSHYRVRKESVKERTCEDPMLTLNDSNSRIPSSDVDWWLSTSKYDSDDLSHSLLPLAVLTPDAHSIILEI